MYHCHLDWDTSQTHLPFENRSPHDFPKPLSSRSDLYHHLHEYHGLNAYPPTESWIGKAESMFTPLKLCLLENGMASMLVTCLRQADYVLAIALGIRKASEEYGTPWVNNLFGAGAENVPTKIHLPALPASVDQPTWAASNAPEAWSPWAIDETLFDV